MHNIPTRSPNCCKLFYFTWAEHNSFKLRCICYHNTNHPLLININVKRTTNQQVIYQNHWFDYLPTQVFDSSFRYVPSDMYWLKILELYYSYSFLFESLHFMYNPTLFSNRKQCFDFKLVHYFSMLIKIDNLNHIIPYLYK